MVKFTGKHIWQSLFFKKVAAQRPVTDEYCVVFRSSHQRCSIKKGILRNLTKFTWRHLCQSLFLNKVYRGLQLYLKRLWHRCFLVNFAKFIRTSFFTEHLWTTASEFYRTTFEKQPCPSRGITRTPKII